MSNARTGAARGILGATRTPLEAGYWLLVLPALALMLALYVYPLLEIFWISVSEPAPGLSNYQKLLGSGSIGRIALTTLRVCVETTCITVLLGYLVAYAMAHVGHRQLRVMMVFVLLPFWMSVLIRAFAWVMLLRTEGVINSGLTSLGVVEEPLRLVRNEVGVVIGMVHFMLPLAILPIFANLSTINPVYVAAARGLGASAAQSFRIVYLPMSKPGIAAATLLVFVFSLGFFVTPAILGGGRVVMISEYISIQIQELLRWGLGAALSMTLLACTFIVLAVAARLIDLRKVFGAR